METKNIQFELDLDKLTNQARGAQKTNLLNLLNSTEFSEKVKTQLVKSLTEKIGIEEVNKLKDQNAQLAGGAVANTIFNLVYFPDNPEKGAPINDYDIYIPAKRSQFPQTTPKNTLEKQYNYDTKILKIEEPVKDVSYIYMEEQTIGEVPDFLKNNIFNQSIIKDFDLNCTQATLTLKDQDQNIEHKKKDLTTTKEFRAFVTELEIDVINPKNPIKGLARILQKIEDFKFTPLQAETNFKYAALLTSYLLSLRQGQKATSLPEWKHELRTETPKGIAKFKKLTKPNPFFEVTFNSEENITFKVKDLGIDWKLFSELKNNNINPKIFTGIEIKPPNTERIKINNRTPLTPTITINNNVPKVSGMNLTTGRGMTLGKLDVMGFGTIDQNLEKPKPKRINPEAKSLITLLANPGIANARNYKIRFHPNHFLVTTESTPSLNDIYKFKTQITNYLSQNLQEITYNTVNVLELWKPENQKYLSDKTPLWGMSTELHNTLGFLIAHKTKNITAEETPENIKNYITNHFNDCIPSSPQLAQGDNLNLSYSAAKEILHPRNYYTLAQALLENNAHELIPTDVKLIVPEKQNLNTDRKQLVFQVFKYAKKCPDITKLTKLVNEVVEQTTEKQVQQLQNEFIDFVTIPPHATLVNKWLSSPQNAKFNETLDTIKKLPIETIKTYVTDYNVDFTALKELYHFSQTQHKNKETTLKIGTGTYEELKEKEKELADYTEVLNKLHDKIKNEIKTKLNEKHNTKK
jgi:hypothetical protein